MAPVAVSMVVNPLQSGRRYSGHNGCSHQKENNQAMPSETCIIVGVAQRPCSVLRVQDFAVTSHR